MVHLERKLGICLTDGFYIVQDGKQLTDEDDESFFNTPLVIGIVGAVVFVAAIAVCIWDQKIRSQKTTPNMHQTGTMVV